MPLKVLQDDAAPQPKVNPQEQEQARVKGALKSITKKIGVHSGKGGVGKTFVACNLAMALAAEGHAVGLLDADVDCPNVPQFLNLKAEVQMDDEGKIVPLLHKGIKILSTGFIQPDGEPLIIRGPIKHRVLTDFLELGRWGELDYLIIDFPPGTSDVPLSAMQYADLTGVILVTTPHKESIADVTRACHMARKLGIPIIGLIENMSGDIFGSKGEQVAQHLNVPYLGSIPLRKDIRELAEQGEPAFLYPVLDSFTSSLLKHVQ
jgi:ATP-binding protein involved in chromosome partitioning